MPRRGCIPCGITAHGMVSPRARISPSGVIHLLRRDGTTFCGKRPSELWLRP